MSPNARRGNEIARPGVLPWLLRSGSPITVSYEYRSPWCQDVCSDSWCMLIVHPDPSRDSHSNTSAPRALHDPRPKVSLVSVADYLPPTALRALADRAARWEHLGVELIIVCASRTTTASTVSAVSGGARLIYGPADANGEQLRAVGFAAANGDVVVLVDDATAKDDRWIEHVSLTGAVAAPLSRSETVPEAPRG